MIPTSRLYSFIDQKNGFSLQFFDGQKLINDLAIIHQTKGDGFRYFRNSVLSIQMLSVNLKSHEHMGVYIDSDIPYFRLKIEMSETGLMRTLLLPENFEKFPETITGRCRVLKYLPENTAPYNSIIDINNLGLNDIVNSLLKFSFQFNAQVFLSEISDQCIMIQKLPEINIDKIKTDYILSIDDYYTKHMDNFLKIFENFTATQDEIRDSFEKIGLIYLSSKEIKFHCSCSKERMNKGIWSIIISSSLEEVFKDPTLETKCDYCHKVYHFAKDEFLN